MGTWIRAFSSEMGRWFLSFKRSIIWPVGLILFAIIGIASFYPLDTLPNDFTLYPPKVIVFSLYSPLFKDYYMAIVLLLSSLLISEDTEYGTWNILQTTRISKFPYIVAKFAWILIYAIAGSFVTVFVFTLYISSSIGHFAIYYFTGGIELVLSYSFIIALTALFGLTISAIFAKRVYSVLAAAAYYVFLVAVSLNLYTTMFVDGSGYQDGFPGYNIHIPFIDKLVILMAPTTFHGAAASLIGLHTIIHNYLNGGAPSNQITIFFPLLFSNPLGYILPFLILTVSSVTLMWVTLFVKRRLF